MVQSFEHLTHDISSDLDLRVVSSSPALGSLLGVEPTLKKEKKRCKLQSVCLKERSSCSRGASWGESRAPGGLRVFEPDLRVRKSQPVPSKVETRTFQVNRTA